MSDFASSGLTAGQLNALVKIIGGESTVRQVLRGAVKLTLTDVAISAFSPATFIAKGWSYAEARDSRSAALGLLDDYNKVKLSTDWLQNAMIVHGEIRRKRILVDEVHTPLNADHFLDLWNNKQKIPEAWGTVKNIVTFDGDIIQDSFGGRWVLYLYWNGSYWGWDLKSLGNGLNANNLSAVVAN